MKREEHYAEAERLIELAGNCDWSVEISPYRDPALAAAQVHALLALGAEPAPAELSIALCSQCGERLSAMVKVGTSDGWCTVCLDEAAEPVIDVAGLCHWTQNRDNVQDHGRHRAFHFGNSCPYEVVAAVLRGERDPRDLVVEQTCPGGC